MHPTPRASLARATFGPFSYTFTRAAWVKVSGTGGNAWIVNMGCK